MNSTSCVCVRQRVRQFEIPIVVKLLQTVTVGCYKLGRCWFSSINRCSLFVDASAFVLNLADMFIQNTPIGDSPEKNFRSFGVRIVSCLSESMSQLRFRWGIFGSNFSVSEKGDRIGIANFGIDLFRFCKVSTPAKRFEYCRFFPPNTGSNMVYAR